MAVTHFSANRPHLRRCRGSTAEQGARCARARLAESRFRLGRRNPAAGDLDEAALRLTLSNPRAPFRAPLQMVASPTRWSDVSGAPITTPAAVLELHPEAARRLAKLLEVRLGAPLIRPVPVAMLVTASPCPQGLRTSTGISRANPSASPRTRGVVPRCAGAADRPHRRRRAVPGPHRIAARIADRRSGNARGRRCGRPERHRRARRHDSAALSRDRPAWNGYVPTRDVATLKVVSAPGAEVSVVTGNLVSLAAGERIGRTNADNTAETNALQGGNGNRRYSGDGRTPPRSFETICSAAIARRGDAHAPVLPCDGGRSRLASAGQSHSGCPSTAYPAMTTRYRTLRCRSCGPRCPTSTT